MGLATDTWGNRVTASDAESVLAWRSAVDELLRFTGDPIATLDSANTTDPTFVMGSAFGTAYRILGGAPPTSAAVLDGLDRMSLRSAEATDQERCHVAATRALVGGEFDDAARQWDAIAVDYPRDLVALKLAHDVCLHIGDDDLRLPSAQRAVASGAFDGDNQAAAVVYADLAFALEEVGEYDEAERWGRAALEREPSDLWARHALTHVYESTARHDDAIELLVPTAGSWSTRTSLVHHMWWHVGLRLLHHGSIDAAIDVLDEKMTSTMTFGLADTSSLLWRIELATSVPGSAERWETLANHWAAQNEVHTSAFLDIHAALAFAAHPGRAADRFWQGLAESHTGSTFNDQTFDQVVRPIAAALRDFRQGDHVVMVKAIDEIGDGVRRIGGSLVQRDLISDTVTRARD